MSRAKKIILFLLIFAALFFAVMMLATVFIMHQNFGRGDYPANRTGTAYNWYPRFAKDYPREAVEFPSCGLRLKGWIYGMKNTGKLLIFSHGIGSGHEFYLSTLLWFVDHGWRVFAYDACGSGDSPGKATKGLVQSALDLDSALTFAETDPRMKDMPKTVMGHSWGGYAAGAVLNFHHDIKAAVSISGYAYPMEMLDVGAVGAVGKNAAVFFHPFAWLYNKMMFGKYAGLNAVDGINGSNVPVLVLHGADDSFVITDQVGIVSKQLGSNAQCRKITGKYAHHNDFFHSQNCNDTVARWCAAHNIPETEPHEQKIMRFANANDSDEARALFREQNEPLLGSINDFLNAYA